MASRKTPQTATPSQPTRSSSALPAAATQPSKWRMRSKQIGIGIGIFIITTLFVFTTGTDVGLTNDAPGWVLAPSLRPGGEGEWIENLLRGNFATVLNKEYTAKCWELPYKDFPDQTQPPLSRTWFWLVWRFFGRSMGVMAGFRLGAASLFGILLAVLLPWLARRYGWVTGIATGVLLLFSPRVLVNAQFLSWDIPALTFMVLGTLAFDRGMRTGKWVLFFACFAFAALTKFTGLLFPLPLLVWGWWISRKNSTYKLPNPFLYILQGGIVSGLIILLLWPDLWIDPLYRFSTYAYQFTAARGACLYFNEYYGATPLDFHKYASPWHYPFVIFLVTTPFTVLLFLLVGLAKTAMERLRDPIPVLFAFSAFFHLVLVSQSNGYHVERPLIPGIVFFTILAGIGVGHFCDRLPEYIRILKSRFAVRCTVIALVVVTMAFSWRSVAPQGIVYFNAVLGGTRQALSRFGMESAYWTTYLNTSFCAFLNQNAKPNARVQLVGMITGSLNFYHMDNLLRRDISIDNGTPCPASSLSPQKIMAADYLAVCTFEEFSTRNYLQPEFSELLDANAKPVFGIEPDNTPILRLYERDNLLSRMTDVRRDDFHAIPAIDLGGVSLEGFKKDPDTVHISAGDTIFREFLFTVKSSGADPQGMRPFTLTLLDSSGKYPVKFANVERTHKFKRYENTCKPNPDYRLPLLSEYRINVHGDMNHSIPPAVFGAGNSYKMRMPVKIPRTLQSGEYVLAIDLSTQPSSVSRDGLIHITRLTVDADRSLSGKARVGIAFGVLCFLFAVFYGVELWKTRQVKKQAAA